MLRGAGVHKRFALLGILALAFALVFGGCGKGQDAASSTGAQAVRYTSWVRMRRTHLLST